MGEQEEIKIVAEKKRKRYFAKDGRELTPEEAEILEGIKQVQEELMLVRMRFDMATDESLIDSYIYEIIALNKKYQYYLRLAKKNGVIAQGFEKIG